MCGSSASGQGPAGALPEAHLTALLMQGAGLSDEQIAKELGIPPESVRATLRVARRKALRALRSDQR